MVPIKRRKKKKNKYGYVWYIISCLKKKKNWDYYKNITSEYSYNIVIVPIPSYCSATRDKSKTLQPLELPNHIKESLLIFILFFDDKSHLMQCCTNINKII